jgi:hypothetical protein
MNQLLTSTNVFRNFVQPFHRVCASTFLAHLRLVLYRTIETNVKHFTTLNLRQFCLINLPLSISETRRLFDLIFHLTCISRTRIRRLTNLFFRDRTDVPAVTAKNETFTSASKFT